MKHLFLSLSVVTVLVACTPGPIVEMNAAAVKQFVSDATETDIQVIVESQNDTDGDFENLQRELTVVFLLPDSADVPSVTLPNGVVLKRGVHSEGFTARVVHAHDRGSWKTAKIELIEVDN